MQNKKTCTRKAYSSKWKKFSKSATPCHVDPADALVLYSALPLTLLQYLHVTPWYSRILTSPTLQHQNSSRDLLHACLPVRDLTRVGPVVIMGPKNLP